MADDNQLLFQWVGWTVQFALAMSAFVLLLRAASARRPRWNISRRLRGRQPPRWWLRAMGADRDSPALRERASLLAGSGIQMAPELYLAAMRTLQLLLPALGLAAYGLERSGALSSAEFGYSLTALAAGMLLALCDRMFLDAYRRYRADRIRKELVVVSSQLLYYSGSRLHLHGKLARCLPYTKLMRQDMQLLLNEWYHRPDTALARFRERLGTDEAYGFVETIRTLRMGESEEVYDMIREMAKEYKAKIELARAGRKETVSYALFVLAGIPILYTFQIFLYPWVQQSQQLFDMLNA